MQGETAIKDIEYCEGWKDYANMGVSCVCTCDMDSHLSRVFTTSRLPDLAEYVRDKATGGFNTRRFDMPLLEVHGVTFNQDKHFDALEQIWLRLGLDPDQFSELHKGWGLDAGMQATFGLAKTGHGAVAPIWWQQGHHSKVIDYCLNDVWLEAKLIAHMLKGGEILGKPSRLSFEGM